MPSMAAVDTGSTTQDRPLIVPRSAIPPAVKVSRMKKPPPICWLVPLPVHPVLPYSLSVEVRVVAAMAQPSLHVLDVNVTAAPTGGRCCTRCDVRAHAPSQRCVRRGVVTQVGVLGAVDAGRCTGRGTTDSVDPSAVDVAIGVRPHNRIGPRVGSLGCIPQRKSTQRVAVGGCGGSCSITRAGA